MKKIWQWLDVVFLVLGMGCLIAAIFHLNDGTSWRYCGMGLLCCIGAFLATFIEDF